MSIKVALRWILAFFCAVMCYYAAQSWLSGQGFTSVLHYSGSSAPDYETYRLWQEKLAEEPVPEIVSTAVWSSGSPVTLNTEVKSATVDIFYAAGNASLILPTQVLSGHMPVDDPYSIALDSVSANALFGATHVSGQMVKFNDQEYTVCGVFKAPSGLFSWGNSTGRGIAFVPPKPKDKIMSLGLLLDKSPEEAVNRANNLAMPMGASGYTEDRQLFAEFIRQFGLLPLWIWAITALIPLARGIFRFIRRGPMFDPLISTFWQRLWDKISRVLAIAAFAGATFGLYWLTDFSPTVPTAWLPTRWSDFDHWKQLLTTLGETWAKARQHPMLRPELMRWTLSAIAVIFCILALVFKPRKITGSFPAFMLLAALIPAFAIAVAWYLGSEILFTPVLILLPAVCVLMQWLGHGFSNAKDYRGAIDG